MPLSAGVMLAVCAIACVAHAERPYMEVPDVLSKTNTLSGTTVSVHGLIDKLEKDGISSTTFFIKLDGGMKCRISRDAFKDKKTPYGKAQRLFEFKAREMTDLVIELRGAQIFKQGTDVIIRGTFKKEMNQWIVDRAVIRGCGEPDVRSALDIRCGGPCNRTNAYYSECGICGSSQL